MGKEDIVRQVNVSSYVADTEKFSPSIGFIKICSMAKSQKIQYYGAIQKICNSRAVMYCNKKISRALGMIRHTKQYLPLSMLQNMNRSMIEPFFRFYFPVWDSVVISKLFNKGVLGTTS